MTSITPTLLEADRGTSTYIGRLGRDAFVVVVGFNNFGWGRKPRKPLTAALLYRWSSFSILGNDKVDGFSGPHVLDDQALKALHVPEQTPLPPFPLMSFVFPGQ